MPIYARGPESNFSPAPQGLHQGVCCDIWKPWVEENKFNPGAMVEKTRIVWQLDVLDDEGHSLYMPNGKPFEVSGKYTLSLHEKSTLTKTLESWRGKPLSKEEKEGFDLERLIGVNGQISVVHAIGDNGKVYANVSSIVPVGRGQAPLFVSDDFIRHDMRDKAVEDDPVPF